MLSRPHIAFALAALGLVACDRPEAASPSTPTAKPAAAPAPVPTSAPVAHSAEAPLPFQGEWNTALADCGGGAGDSRLVIEARRMVFYESGGPITQVVAAGPREASFKLLLNGEGETFERAYRFRLSPDNQTLTDLDAGLARKRCP